MRRTKGRGRTVDPLHAAARQAANALYNIVQYDRPLTTDEKTILSKVRIDLDEALAITRGSR